MVMVHGHGIKASCHYFSIDTFSSLGGRIRGNRELDLTKFIIQPSEGNKENDGEGGEGGCEEVMVRKDHGI